MKVDNLDGMRTEEAKEEIQGEMRRGGVRLVIEGRGHLDLIRCTGFQYAS